MAAIGTSSFLVCLLVQLTLVNSALLTHLQGCPNNLAHEPNVEVFGSKCYIFYAGIHRTESTADWICKRRDGSLATPKTPEINSFLAKQMGHYNMDSAWIGLKRIHTSSFTRYFKRDFQWNDGSSVNYNNFHPFSSVPFYADSATYMDDDGYWLEESDSQSFSLSLFHSNIKRSFICEVDRDPAFVTESDSDPKAEEPYEGENDSEVDDESEAEKGDETKTDDDDKKPDKPSDTPADGEGDEEDPQKTDDGEEEEDKGLANLEADDQDLNDTEKSEPVSDNSDSSVLNDTEKSEPVSDSSDSSILNDTEKSEPVSDSSDSSMDNETDSDIDDGKETTDDEGGQKHHCQFECHLDCGMMGYLTDSETGCAICECDED